MEPLPKISYMVQQSFLNAHTKVLFEWVTDELNNIFPLKDSEGRYGIMMNFLEYYSQVKNKNILIMATQIGQKGQPHKNSPLNLLSNVDTKGVSKHYKRSNKGKEKILFERKLDGVLHWIKVLKIQTSR